MTDREPEDQADAPSQEEQPKARRGWLNAATLGTGLLVVIMVAAGILAAIMVTPPPDEEALARPDDTDVVLAFGAPVSWDPAAIGDSASAQMLSQVYEGLTTFDAEGHVRPALAESWSVEDDGRRIVFELRPGITFSDGSPIAAADVRRTWLRVIDPARPSPLSSLLDDVAGAAAYSRGTGGADDVGITAEGGTLTVDFERPASYFPAVAAVPSLAVVPAGIEAQARGPRSEGTFISSGAYVPVEQTRDQVRLRANPDHWAAEPPLERITVVTDEGGRSRVDIFEDGAVDWTSISPSDASWIRYDRRLGPQLRRSEEMAVDLLGFDTSEPPFDDAAARRAVAMAVDWRRLGSISHPSGRPATSLLPPGVAGRDDEDHVLEHDPEAARAALAEAGFPDGAGFPEVTLATYGVGESTAIAEELRRELGIEVRVEERPFAEHSTILDLDTPDMWTLAWSADYPHAHDFLGLLLRSGSSANTGGWSDPAYDALIDEAAATADPDEQVRLYGQAQAIVREEAPLIPMSYSETWALGREGLRGADVSGVGLLRFGELAWSG